MMPCCYILPCICYLKINDHCPHHMKHALLYQDWLEGWQYGTHRALEQEIVRQTNAAIIHVPENNFEKRNKRMEHGRRFQSFRKWVPKKELTVQADVAWHILMAPG